MSQYHHIHGEREHWQQLIEWTYCVSKVRITPSGARLVKVNTHTYTLKFPSPIVSFSLSLTRACVCVCIKGSCSPARGAYILSIFSWIYLPSRHTFYPFISSSAVVFRNTPPQSVCATVCVCVCSCPNSVILPAQSSPQVNSNINLIFFFIEQCHHHLNHFVIPFSC